MRGKYNNILDIMHNCLEKKNTRLLTEWKMWVKQGLRTSIHLKITYKPTEGLN